MVVLVVLHAPRLALVCVRVVEDRPVLLVFLVLLVALDVVDLVRVPYILVAGSARVAMHTLLTTARMDLSWSPSSTATARAASSRKLTATTW